MPCTLNPLQKLQSVVRQFERLKDDRQFCLLRLAFMNHHGPTKYNLRADWYRDLPSEIISDEHALFSVLSDCFDLYWRNLVAFKDLAILMSPFDVKPAELEIYWGWVVI